MSHSSFAHLDATVSFGVDAYSGAAGGSEVRKKSVRLNKNWIELLLFEALNESQEVLGTFCSKEKVNGKPPGGCAR